jgi:hypothetical protein
MAAQLEPILAVLASRGALAYQALPPAEQAWRGRYLMMVAAVSRSPVYAWANALAIEGEAADAVRQLVTATPDERIPTELVSAGINIEDLVLYD